MRLCVVEFDTLVLICVVIGKEDRLMITGIVALRCVA